MPKAKGEANENWASLTFKVRGHSSTSVLFARLHAGKEGAGRTLFVTSLPPSLTAAEIQTAFEHHGAVSAVTLGEIDGGRTSTRTAHVTFAKSSGVKKALSSRKALQAESAVASAHTMESREELQESVDSFLRNFEADEQRRHDLEDAQHGQMDSDGFVMVTRKRQGRQTASDGNATMSAASQGSTDAKTANREKKKKKPDNIDFYQFQKHERKREQLVKLREQFEADKARITKMRNERKFRPY